MVLKSFKLKLRHLTLLALAFVLFDITAFFLLKDTTKDFMTSCSGLDESKQTQQACVTEWLKTHGKEVELKDAMDMINTKFMDNKFSLNSCHAWKHYTTEAFLKLSKIDLDSGIATCKKDNLKCDGGCLHTVIEEAVVKNGKSQQYIDHIKKLCLDLGDKESVAECIHGIGHGLARLLNNNFALLGALQYCDNIVSAGDLREKCYSGVFHITNLVGTTNRASFQASLLSYHQGSPCASLPERYQNSCYGEFSRK